MKLDAQVAALTIGTIRNIERRREMLGFDELGEIENQFQIPISGTATSVLTFAPVSLDFDVAFVMAPEQRDSALTMPHFHSGVYLSTVDVGAGNDLTQGIEVVVNVREWGTDEDTGVVTGAALLVGVRGEATYAGFVHLTFQGFGAPVEVTPDDLDMGA